MSPRQSPWGEEVQRKMPVVGQTARVELHQVEREAVEIRLFDGTGDSSYRSWKMPGREATDLARWCRRNDARVEDARSPARDLRFGSVLISTLGETVYVRGFDKYGGIRPIGFHLPREVVEHLRAHSPDERG